MYKDQPLFCYPQKIKDTPNVSLKSVKDTVEMIIDEYAYLKDTNTNPGFVIISKKPSRLIYCKAVTQVVALDEILNILDTLHAGYQGYKNQRGLIGATSAIAWKPTNDTTFELITYRNKKKWGTPRTINPQTVQEMDQKFPSTFDSYDYDNAHNRIVPNSPCPILYGIRGDHADDLPLAMSMIQSESVESWLIFQTNQGTDDHIQQKTIAEIQPYESVIVQGKIIQTPHTIQGGHVIFKLQDSTGGIDCAAYEPTKQFRQIIRALTPGDIVSVMGGVREQPLTINLEKINIIHLVDRVEKLGNPVCPDCGKHMKSRGHHLGFKCRRCGTTQQKPITRIQPRKISVGWYETPVCARRHLSKPLKRMKNVKKS
jgi:tRNA(Ile2)-agmatinylcytidine synthase